MIGWNHWQDMFLIRNLDVEDIRAIVGEHLLQGRSQVPFLAHCRRAATVSFGDLHEIGITFFRVRTLSRTGRLGVVDRTRGRYERDCLS